MARSALSMILLLALIAVPPGALAQGRSGGSSGGSGDRPDRTGPPSRAPSGSSTERVQKPEEAQKQQRVQERERSHEPRERPGRAPETSAAPSETGGFLGTIRRFFGFERSQERMSEQGREHERATEQRRGPATDADGGPAKPEASGKPAKVAKPDEPEEK